MARKVAPMETPEEQEELALAHETIRGKAKSDRMNEKMEHEIEAHLTEIESIRGSMPCEITGHVYREVTGMGRFREDQIGEVIDDHVCGLMFGPGKWRIVYRYRTPSMPEGSELKTCTIIHNIGMGYSDLHREWCTMNGKTCRLPEIEQLKRGSEKQPSPLELLSKEKAESFSLLLTTIIGILRPPQQGDNKEAIARQDKLLYTLIENMSKSNNENKSNGSSDKITELLLTNALEKKDPAKEMETMFGLMERIEKLRGKDDSPTVITSDPATPFDGIIGKALDILPMFLERFGGAGNEKAAAQALKQENPMVKMLLASKTAQAAFYRKVAKKYGVLSADNWARGFGVDPSMFQNIAPAESRKLPSPRRKDPTHQVPPPEPVPAQEPRPGFVQFGRGK